MDLKKAGGVLLLLAIVGVIAFGAITDQSDAEKQTDRAEEVVNQTQAGKFDLEEADCETFDELKTGVTTTCDAKGVAADGSEQPATAKVTALDCHSIGTTTNSDKQTVCDFRVRARTGGS
jgi:hypothetical protein